MQKYLSGNLGDALLLVMDLIYNIPAPMNRQRNEGS